MAQMAPEGSDECRPSSPMDEAAFRNARFPSLCVIPSEPSRFISAICVIAATLVWVICGHACRRHPVASSDSASSAAPSGGRCATRPSRPRPSACRSRWPARSSRARPTPAGRSRARAPAAASARQQQPPTPSAARRRHDEQVLQVDARAAPGTSSSCGRTARSPTGVAPSEASSTSAAGTAPNSVSRSRSSVATTRSSRRSYSASWRMNDRIDRHVVGGRGADGEVGWRQGVGHGRVRLGSGGPGVRGANPGHDRTGNRGKRGYRARHRTARSDRSASRDRERRSGSAGSARTARCRRSACSSRRRPAFRRSHEAPARDTVR